MHPKAPAVALALLAALALAAPASAQHRRRTDRFRVEGRIEPEAAAAVPPSAGATEAQTGFDNLSNGYLEQGPPFEELDDDSVVALRSFNDNRFIFEEVEGPDEASGPPTTRRAAASATRTS